MRELTARFSRRLRPKSSLQDLTPLESNTPALAVVVDQTGLDFSRNALDMGSGSFQEGGMD
jgi:hypothetical protein